MIENGQPSGGYLLSFGSLQLPFQIEYRNRRSLAITVHPDQRLEIVAPRGADLDRLLKRIEKRQAWILSQWRYFEQFKPASPLPSFVSGETCLYLGRQYRLKVHKASSETVKLVGRFLHVWTHDKADRHGTKQLVEAWYRSHAEQLFLSRIGVWFEKSPSLRLPQLPKVTVRKMQKRWGSCTKAGNIVLNPELVKTPIHCIDYVIVHELCHRLIHNHGPAYYRLLARCLPDWEVRKARLEACCG
ncbi:MAG TPA: SprT family zinc-dependent metalloprotease [Gemmataceae bacterium]|nr:SprT family zinc-dependent metalloprotease [Pirellulales bacterium]HZZ78453.1 SprT family zinc-dependent metalloprotease [Gemmataceae bacterium]